MSIRMSLPKTEVVKDALKFTNRWDLDSLELVNRYFAQIIRSDFSMKPYRVFRKLIIRIFDPIKKNDRPKLPCTVLYEHQIKEMSFEQVVNIFGNPNIRFTSTYIAIDADCTDMEQFFEFYYSLKHLWEGKSFIIDMDPYHTSEQMCFFGTLFDDGITTNAGNLAIIDRSYIYTPESEFSPFMYIDIKICRQITIASGMTLELAKSLVDWLHDGAYKELTWVFLFDELKIAYQQAEIVVALIQELGKKFWASENPAPYKFWIINVFHECSLPIESCNETTEELLIFEKGVFRNKRYHSGLEESAFCPGSVDIKVERNLIDDYCPSSIISTESDSACSSSKIVSEVEMSF